MNDQTMSAAALRAQLVAWQRFTTRYRRASEADIANCVKRLSCVQIDSVATVERSHFLVLAARIGVAGSNTVSQLLAQGQLFEYWAHECCLVHVDDWPLFRRRMDLRHVHHWWGPVIQDNPDLAAKILDRIRVHGPLGSRHFEGERKRGMWEHKPAKRMLDALWTAGKLVVCRREGFQRLYDLPERVIPRSVLGQPPLNEMETLRALIVRAVSARGALTLRGIVDHYRLEGGTTKIAPHLAALCDGCCLSKVAVTDGGPPVYVPTGFLQVSLDLPAGGVLLSPFENLLWDRQLVARLFEFDHLIEIYKRREERTYGYYVLPFLLRDRLVGRADLKAQRDKNVLRVIDFQLSPGVRQTLTITSQFERAVSRLARILGLQYVEGLSSV